jgi:ribonuclease D
VTVGRAGAHEAAWFGAVAAGIADRAVPEEEGRALFDPPRPDWALIARRRALEARVSSWRASEAKRRGVDPQAVLPGHCVDDLIDVVLAYAGAPLAAAILAIPGFGQRRFERYGRELVELVTNPGRPEPRA